MPTLDVFNQDPFSTNSLTASFIKTPHQPLRLGASKLFQEAGVRTTSVTVESMDGRLSLIQSSPRGGAAADPVGKNARTMRNFNVYHFERDSKVYADEIQNIRAFGSETELQQIEQLVQERMAELVAAHEVTLEYHRANAIQGVLLDADGSTLKNLFTEFGVSQQTHDIALGTATTKVRERIVAAKRLAEAELGGEVILGWRGFLSPEYWDALTSHTLVVNAYQYQQGEQLQKDLRSSGFNFADVMWEEYRGSVTKPTSVGGGTATFMPADIGWLVPVTANPMFITRFAPADYEETVNTLGLPRYAKMAPDPSGLNKYRLLNTQSNHISLCLRPRAVIKLTKS
jgi:hypothetical protein